MNIRSLHKGWQLARRAEKMNPSVIREILKVTERPGIISLAGGLPSPLTFPVDEVARAAARILAQDGAAALQYAASEGYGPLRDWVAEHLGHQGLQVDAAQILITTGSQQGLDLAAKVLIEYHRRQKEQRAQALKIRAREVPRQSQQARRHRDIFQRHRPRRDPQKIHHCSRLSALSCHFRRKNHDRKLVAAKMITPTTAIMISAANIRG